MSGASPPLPPPRPTFPWDGPRTTPPSSACASCKPPDDDDDEKKEGKLDLKVDQPMSPDQMERFGIEKGNEMLRANPSMDYVEIKVTGVDPGGTPWTVTGGQTRAAMDAASQLGGRGVDAVSSGGAFKNLSPFRAVGL